VLVDVDAVPNPSLDSEEVAYGLAPLHAERVMAEDSRDPWSARIEDELETVSNVEAHISRMPVYPPNVGRQT
jgi:translation elongation factor EF-1beta